MATAEQLQLLQQAKRWYPDATFYVVRRSFQQLFSVHAFVRKGDSLKQVPLAFYKATLRQLLGELPAPPRVSEVYSHGF